MKILLTGFEPFGGETVNPSEGLAQALAAEHLPDAELRAIILPVAFGPDVEAAWATWDDFQPDLFLALGQGVGPAIRIERYAHNTRREREMKEGKFVPSNSEQPIIPDGPVAYETPLPVFTLESALREAEIPSVVSRDAGDYVCTRYIRNKVRLRDNRDSLL